MLLLLWGFYDHQEIDYKRGFFWLLWAESNETPMCSVVVDAVDVTRLVGDIEKVSKLVVCLFVLRA